MSGKRQSTFKIGITGNVCTGKTLVLSSLQRHGVVILDAEQAAWDLLSDNPQRLSIRLTEHFGSDVLDSRGRLSRKQLAKNLYTDPSKKAFFDEKLNPVMREETKRFLYGSMGTFIRAVESPTLLEDDMGHLFDEVWMVVAEPQVQVERLMSRNWLTETEARHLVDSQWPQQKKRALSDRIIDNSSDIYQTESQVKQVLDEIKYRLFKVRL